MLMSLLASSFATGDGAMVEAPVSCATTDTCRDLGCALVLTDPTIRMQCAHDCNPDHRASGAPRLFMISVSSSKRVLRWNLLVQRLSVLTLYYASSSNSDAGYLQGEGLAAAYASIERSVPLAVTDGTLGLACSKPWHQVLWSLRGRRDSRCDPPRGAWISVRTGLR